jgi:cation:H+ antiporter
MPEIILYLLVIAVSTVVVWKGSSYLESSSEKISLYYGLPPAVHGAVVVAVGSSFPELSGVVLSTLLHGDFELGLSTIIGSAIFNIMIIPALSGIFSRNNIQVDKEVIYRDSLFYIISVAVLFITFSFAVIYLPKPGAELTGNISRTMAAFPILVYLLYIFIQQQEVSDVLGHEKPEIKPGRQWLLLLMSLALVLVGVEGLVRSCIFLGDYLNTPSFVWGITIIAIVTSLPDMLVSIRLARKGQGIPSVSNVLGSNIFDLLIAVPAGVMIAGTTEVNYQVAAPLMGILMLATILLFAFLRTRLTLSKTENWVLMAAYVVFIIWVVLEGTGLVSFLLP